MEEKVKSSILFFQFLIIGGVFRFVQLILMYTLKTPDGCVLAESGVTKLIVRTISADLSFLSIFLLVFIGLSFLSKKQCLIQNCAIAGVAFYLFLTICDNELIRWLNQRLTIGYITTYSNASSDPHIVINIIKGGYLSFGLNILTLILFIVSATFIRKEKRIGKWIIVAIDRLKPSKISSVIIALLILIAAGATYYAYYHPLKGRQLRDRIRPFFVHVYNELEYDLIHREKPDGYEDGITFLGGNPNAEYPFFHKVENDSSLTNFNKKDIDDRPDIIVLTIESLRGWVGDIRIPKSCAAMKNLCKLSKEGLFFPYTFSVGWPSTEGLNGMMQGIWSHPEKFLSSYHVNLRSLPDILGDAGYYRIVQPAANPNFDNFTPLFKKWFEVTDYNPSIDEDVPLANRFKEVYSQRPKDKPVFINWMSTSTHFPFTYPKELGPTPADQAVSYERLATYADSAIGIVLNAIKSDSRANNTIVIISGDHSFATNVQKERLDKIGDAHSGRTWTNLLLVGPGIPKDSIDTRTVSHADIAPTLLHLLNIQTSNNFVGDNLFAKSTFNTNEFETDKKFTFVKTDVVLHTRNFKIYANMYEDSYEILSAPKTPDWDTTSLINGFIGEPFAARIPDAAAAAQKLQNAAKAWEYVLDHDLLYPEE